MVWAEITSFWFSFGLSTPTADRAQWGAAGADLLCVLLGGWQGRAGQGGHSHCRQSRHVHSYVSQEQPRALGLSAARGSIYRAESQMIVVLRDCDSRDYREGVLGCQEITCRDVCVCKAAGTANTRCSKGKQQQYDGDSLGLKHEGLNPFRAVQSSSGLSNGRNDHAGRAEYKCWM